MSARPDIVLLVLDTQRRDRLSCYGFPQETTPHLDRLSADATRFDQAFSAAQWTVPSHTSMFTGRYVPSHRTEQSYSILPPSIPTLAERLREAGYYTTAFCNNPLVGVVNNGLRRGFFSFLNYSGLMTSRPNQAGARPTLIDRYRQLFKRALSGVLHRIQDSFARSDWLLSFSFTPIMVPLWQTALSFKGNTPRSLGDAAKLLIERRGLERDQPVFSFINLMGTHAPYQAHPRHLARFAPDVKRSSAAQKFIRRFNSDVFGWLAPLTGAIDAERKAILDGVYNAETAGQDEQVGIFIERLRSSGALDNTLLIVCADHGEHLGEHQFMGHSFTAYNELLHVPLIIRDPSGNLPRGTTVGGTVSTRRIFQTALTAAGAAHPDEEPYTLANSNGNDPDAHTVFADAVPVTNVLNMMRRRRPDLVRDHRCDQTRRVIVHNDLKLIQTGEHAVELYNVRRDPHEQQELSSIFPEQVETLEQSLVRHLDVSRRSAPEAAVSEQEDSPEVQRRLRDLGYLE
ncbi:MAG: sulfatase [Oscillochloris sp.]|nr:sulfatase [Oscillochloris sp.]